MAEPRYQKIPDDVDNIGFNKSTQTKNPKCCRLLHIVSITTVACVFIAIIIIISIHALLPQQRSTNSFDGDGIVYSCGSSISEAKAMGCKFHPLAMTWLPEECQDWELANAFIQAGDNGQWRYFADEKGVEEVTIDDLAESAMTGKEYILSKNWHLMHCAYDWQKLHRAMINGWKLESVLRNINHSTHCTQVIAHRSPRSRLLTVITPGIDHCW